MAEQVKKVGLFQYMRNSMVRYGKHVLENRSIPDYRDGLKPVQRRILWAMYELGLTGNKLVKTARVVGETLGKYHPHGDKSVSDAITALVQNVTSPIYGEGNWGSVTGDNAAAMRYTILRLSDYGKLFFDPFYMEVIDKVPTYDGAHEEPVILYPMLPHLLISGVGGIGVGANTESPGFTIKSVITTVLEATKNKGGATPELCMKHLEFSDVEGSVVQKRSQVKALMEFFKTGRMAIKHSSRVAYNAKTNEVVVTGVAPFRGVDNYMSQLMAIPELIEDVTAYEDRSKNWTLNIAYPLKRGADGNAVKEAVSNALTSTKHYKMNVTERSRVVKNGFPTTEVQFKASSVPDIINGWLKWRVDLEVRATTHHLAQLDIAIRKNQVLRIACQNVDFIIGLMKDKTKSNDQIKQALQTKLKLSQPEAEVVFRMPWPSLRALEDKAIAAKMVEQAKLRKSYEQRIAKPGAYVVKHITELSAQF